MADTKLGLRMDARRRLFLQAVGMGAAGLAVGGGGSWVYSQLQAGQATSAVTALRLTDAPALTTETNALTSQLTTLNGQLSGVTAQNEQLVAALKIAQDETAALRLRVADLEGQLSSATNRLTDSANVISLYDQLEAVGLDAHPDGARGARHGCGPPAPSS